MKAAQDNRHPLAERITGPRARQARRREAAEAAYSRWERAAKAGLDHYTVGRLWESYLRLAEAAR